MRSDHIKVEISQALDLIQLITEDVESNFIGENVGNVISERATITISSLYILGDYLRGIQEREEKHG